MKKYNKSIIELTEPVKQIDFIKSTIDNWNYVAGSYYDMFNDVSYPSFPDYLESGGILELKKNIEIKNPFFIKRGNWGLHINNLFYTNIIPLVSDRLVKEDNYEIEKFQIKMGLNNNRFDFMISYCEYGNMLELTNLYNIGFSIGILLKKNEERILNYMSWSEIKQFINIEANPATIMLPI